MNPLTIPVLASLRLRRVLLLAHLPLLAAVWLLFGESWHGVPVIGLLLVHAVWQDRRLACPPVSALSVRGGVCQVFCDGQWLDVALHSATVLAWFTQLRLVGQRRSYVIYLLSDNVEADAFRQLRIWLRWDSALAQH